METEFVLCACVCVCVSACVRVRARVCGVDVLMHLEEKHLAEMDIPLGARMKIINAFYKDPFSEPFPESNDPHEAAVEPEDGRAELAPDPAPGGSQFRPLSPRPHYPAWMRRQSTAFSLPSAAEAETDPELQI